MTIDELARRAGTELRSAVEADDLEVLERRLAAVPGAYRRRCRTGAAVVAAAAAAVVVLVVGGALLRPGSEGTVRTPTGPASTAPAVPDPCETAFALRCEGGRQYAVAAPVPYSFGLPAGFGFPGTGRAPDLVDLVQDSGRAGVVVMEDPRPDDGTPRGDAQSLARWISTRPYLDASAPYAVRIDGLGGLKVDAALRSGAGVPRARRCNAIQATCRALLVAGPNGWQIGVWRGMVSGFSVVDLPHGHTLVVWEWAFDPDARALRRNDAVVHGLRIGDTG